MRRRTPYSPLDEQRMRECLRLARLAWGRTSPNPMVGALVVKGNEVVAKGYHQGAGQPHAEVTALSKAGSKAKGATLYVNLEPCSHQGRTPPCVPAIIQAGIKRVVFAARDPYPKVAGRGAERLRRAGIQVAEGVMEGAARELNAVHFKYASTGLPYVVIKMGVSLDGKAGVPGGSAGRITSEQSLKVVHRMRAEMDAVMVGIGTVLADDSQLTVRFVRPRRANRPVRLVVDSHARMPLKAKMVCDASPQPVWVACRDDAPAERVASLLAGGVEVLTGPAAQEGRVDLRRLMRALAKREITSVLVEGGPTLNWSLLAAGLVDKIVVFIAPKLVGGAANLSLLAGTGVESLAESIPVRQMAWRRVGPDLQLVGWLH